MEEVPQPPKPTSSPSPPMANPAVASSSALINGMSELVATQVNVPALNEETANEEHHRRDGCDHEGENHEEEPVAVNVGEAPKKKKSKKSKSKRGHVCAFHSTLHREIPITHMTPSRTLLLDSKNTTSMPLSRQQSSRRRKVSIMREDLMPN